MPGDNPAANSRIRNEIAWAPMLLPISRLMQSVPETEVIPSSIPITLH
jgi:hypothetical protein